MRYKNTFLIYQWLRYFKPVTLTQVSYHILLFQVMTFNIPLTFCLGYQLQYRRSAYMKSSLCHRARHIYFPFCALVVFQTYIAMSEFPAAYGTRALVLGPVRTGSVILAVILYFIVRKTTVNYLVGNHSN